jgi:RND family efflux transporter MFP subunit
MMQRRLAASLALLAACSGPAPPRKRPLPHVAAVKVATRDVPVEVRAPVDLRPLAQADLGSKTLGYLDAVLVDRGDRVRRGQVLALVRPSDLPDQLAAARSNLAQTQATLSLARANAERARNLAPSGVVSQQELQQAESSAAAAEAQASAIQSQVGALAIRLGETRIPSPLDGVVWQRRLDPGALVGQPTGGIILTVAQIDVMRVFIAVNERWAGRIHTGQNAYVELDALPGRRFEGKVVRLSPGFDPTTRTLEAEVRIANPKGELRPGMYGRGAIVVDVHREAPVAPVAAVQISGGKKWVFVVEGDVVHRREVESGVDGGTWVEITRGLKRGEELVTAGAEGLAEAAKVRVAHNVDPYTGARLVEEEGAPKPDSGKL